MVHTPAPHPPSPAQSHMMSSCIQTTTIAATALYCLLCHHCHCRHCHSQPQCCCHHCRHCAVGRKCLNSTDVGLVSMTPLPHSRTSLRVERSEVERCGGRRSGAKRSERYESFLDTFGPFGPQCTASAPSTFLDASSHLYKRVCPSVRPSVVPSVCDAFAKIAENGVMQDGDASYVVYTALLRKRDRG